MILGGGVLVYIAVMSWPDAPPGVHFGGGMMRALSAKVLILSSSISLGFVLGQLGV